jgi:hypothetical protein
VVDKDQSDGNCAKQVKVDEIPRIIRGQTVRGISGLSYGAWGMGEAGGRYGLICPVLVGLRLVENALHNWAAEEGKTLKKGGNLRARRSGVWRIGLLAANARIPNGNSRIF